jgi:16S rRNA (guanine1516-N2)-methyltransferase
MLAAELRSLGFTIGTDSQPGTMELCFTVKGLMLRETGSERAESILVDFASESFLYRLQRGGGRKQPLARAIGLKPGYSPQVLDATAGLGRDGFLLASLGCRVILCERSALIHALLRDGLTRAASDPRLSAIASRITLYLGDALTLLSTLPQDRPEVIYLDPMFPHRTKSALVKKEMRMVRMVVGDDSDTSDLLKEALAQAGKRVVCKRPIQAESLEGPRPDFTITTPKHRFDIYLAHPRITNQGQDDVL